MFKLRVSWAANLKYPGIGDSLLFILLWVHGCCACIGRVTRRHAGTGSPGTIKRASPGKIAIMIPISPGARHAARAKKPALPARR
jgi:hypothetical protein